MINNIIPTPKETTLSDGSVSLPLCCECTEPAWQSYANTLSSSFAKLFGRALSEGEGGIRLVRDASLPAGHYTLDTRDGATLSASDDEGILYAIASLLLSAQVQGDRLTLPKALVRDFPDSSYRALMVDLARQWHPLPTVLQYIDLCFILKIKYLHLHFCDDQRYTLPSSAFPHLADKGAYTREDIAQMRSYAQARGVILVPEIEVPGHATVLTRAYPETFANHLLGEGELLTNESGDVIGADSLICAGSPAAFAGVKTLLAETAALFPESPYLHIGGDEARITLWDHCPACRAYMQEKGLDGVYELYSELVGRTAKEVLRLGKTPIVWEGFPKKGAHHVPRETIVIGWECKYHMPYDLVEEGFHVINAAWKPLYIVPHLNRRWGIPEIYDWNIYNWQNWWMESAATEKPIQIEPTEQVIGAQLCVWECTFEQAIGRAMENLAALSERTWTHERRSDTPAFLSRAAAPLSRIAALLKAE